MGRISISTMLSSPISEDGISLIKGCFMIQEFSWQMQEYREESDQAHQFLQGFWGSLGRI